MKSFAAIDSINTCSAGTIITCEVENVPASYDRLVEYIETNTFMVDVNSSLFEARGIVPIQGGVYSVIHDGSNITEICCYEEQERGRRIQFLRQFK